MLGNQTTSFRRRTASRAQSRSPVTRDGNARPSRNVVRHALFVALVMLSPDCGAAFRDIQERYIARFAIRTNGTSSNRSFGQTARCASGVRQAAILGIQATLDQEKLELKNRAEERKADPSSGSPGRLDRDLTREWWKGRAHELRDPIQPLADESKISAASRVAIDARCPCRWCG